MREMSMVEMQEVNGGSLWVAVAIGAGLAWLIIYPAWKAIQKLKKMGLWK